MWKKQLGVWRDCWGFVGRWFVDGGGWCIGLGWVVMGDVGIDVDVDVCGFDEVQVFVDVVFGFGVEDCYFLVDDGELGEFVGVVVFVGVGYVVLQCCYGLFGDVDVDFGLDQFVCYVVEFDDVFLLVGGFLEFLDVLQYQVYGLLVLLCLFYYFFR